MKEKNLLAPDDKVVNNATAPPQEKSIGIGILLTLAPAACKMIAETKMNDELAK
jgi:hypothetical protein